MKKIDLSKLIAVKPHARQIAWQKMAYYNFINFGMNTFVGKESSEGSTSPSKFKLKDAAIAEWVKLAKSSGSSGIVFTAKHHDGFCMFNTTYTDYNIMQSPYKKDMIAELAEECRKQGLKFGLHISLIDRNNVNYGSNDYNDFFVNQLVELLSNYGEIFGIWLDMTPPDSKLDKVQEYDFVRYFDTIHKMQSNTIVALCGQDVRWSGLQDGKYREEEWSVINKQFTQYGTAKASRKKIDNTMDITAQKLGGRELSINAEELVWCPAECYTSILNSGFYHSSSKELMHGIKTLEQLVTLYYNTVGNNVNLALGIPVSKNGTISQKITDRLTEFGSRISKDFKDEIAARIIRYRNPKGEIVFDITPSATNVTKFKLQEIISDGQLVEEFNLHGVTKDNNLIMIASGKTIGASKIITIKNQDLVKYRLIITKSLEEVKNLNILLY